MVVFDNNLEKKRKKNTLKDRLRVKTKKVIPDRDFSTEFVSASLLRSVVKYFYPMYLILVLILLIKTTGILSQEIY